MKHIIKREEPKEFTDWKNLSNDDWQATYSIIPTKTKNLVKNNLILEQGGICCYCECRVEENNSHIEHFIPQNNINCDNLDYSNMLCSCQKNNVKGNPRHCGKSKDHDKGCEYHSELLSPLDNKCEEKFKYDIMGNIYSNDLIGNDAIKCYKLNILKLNASRSNAIEELLTLKNNGIDIEILLNKDSNGLYSEFHTMIEYLTKKEIIK